MSWLRDRYFEQELEFKATRSSGPGGQHVNKANTKIELRFNINQSNLLTKTEKARLNQSLASVLTSHGDLIIVSQTSRSQAANREDAIEKFYALLENGLKPVKKRKKTTPPAGMKEKRLEKKKQQSEKKNLRKPPDL
ncbi:MAG: alternative ribosome rescue aminoacyl-tRNA hydrolase ArfB [Bacteroidales bacterium]